ncbi:Dyp-type peroxidase [Spirilliplanes yamanashiensis]|uniref:Dyp-type peroxidase n=1 Tax=Spirilliplanes yamanashiensis TaxID=42233 RepID=A0A8J3YAP7_9ACTN|nr:Dyp-type peroxidase [Spirilliplanes yamanashiensis]MDP9818736.1 deferrochelatase/peroxidase EfeB [Spirilliplanes yamanashiensis]GIJ05191.1 hypothetical protein Sya03_45430 [Spirilliplanes yamanashiensis]
MKLSRRTVVAGGVAAAAGWMTNGCAASPAGRRPEQTGLLAEPPAPHAVVAALDIGVTGRQAVADALRGLAERAAAAPAEVRTMVGLGAGVFERAGLTARRPRLLALMPSFPGDVLDPARTHGDLLIQVEAPDADAAEKALGATVGDLTVRWRMAGFSDVRPAGMGRPVATNLFGFTEGHSNPPTTDVARVGSGQGEPLWAVGGSYQVVRIIRFATALWDRDPVERQEQMIGRRRDGRWLDGTAADADPLFAADPHGRRTPLDSHVRRANPRTGPPPPMLRRGFSFRGTDRAGRTEEGMLFIAFQRDIRDGFEAVQHRLAGERLGRYVLTVGGGYFFVPPPGHDGWWGDGLFAA